MPEAEARASPVLKCVFSLGFTGGFTGPSEGFLWSNAIHRSS